MADIEAIKKLLAEEYGIRLNKELGEVNKELGEALRNIQRLNIGVCVSPVRKESERHEKDRCIA